MALETDVICGANAVAAAMARRPDDAQRMFYTEAMRGVAGPIASVLARVKKPYREVDSPTLARIAETTHHGGIALVCKPRRIAIWSLEDTPTYPLLLILDGVGNPHNLGAIARSAAFFGVRALLMAEGPGHAMPSNAAYRTAEGGMEHLDLFRVRDLPTALSAMDARYRTVGTTIGRLGDAAA